MNEDQKKPQDSKQEEINIPNPFEIWKKVYFSTEDAISSSVREAITTQSFARVIDSMLDTYLIHYKTLTEINNKYLEHSPFPSKKDVARVAELVISLEDKVDKIENGLIVQLSQIVNNLSSLLDNLGQNDYPDLVSQVVSGIDIAHQNTNQIVQLTNRIESLEKAVSRLEGTQKEINKLLKAQAKAQAKTEAKTSTKKPVQKKETAEKLPQE